ncbi:DUF6250 domain-containing protein [Lentisphaera profundi]|uniref:DUF6250 domain-containing protein n=1 Tax=Lentisphaera profundi TaxID=1658616 RepID=A0ABY7VR91_9BACT|nr:DUF6250 domain-containing protein [Lentisphaera profundi]WDE95738.1 DUF6250 domain-containing protein [Lentisphaera profundi]
MKYSLLLVCLFNFALSADDLIYEEQFKDLSAWHIEQMPRGKVTIKQGKFDIIDASGMTMFFKKKLTGDIRIEYKVRMIKVGGDRDRVSDCNVFWKISDPRSPQDIFKFSNERTGAFPDYHKFKTYYVGFGGHNNTKTRFRRYNGQVNRPLLAEHDLKKPLIIPNKLYDISIVCRGNRTVYSIDNQVIYDYTDPKAHEEGWFAFRTVNNHMSIESFKIFSLKE